jgi:tetratricopeptide (TPR) repeat protein
MNREDARKLFCDFSGGPAHASDPRLDGLIADVDYIPHTVKLLAGAARGFPDIEQPQSLWYEKRIAMFPGPDGHSREESLLVAYDFAIHCLEEDALRALKVLACLPEGVAGSDVRSALPGGIQTDVRLHNAALAFREGVPYRLRMLSPLRDYVSKDYPAAAADKSGAVSHYLKLAATGNDLTGPRDGFIVKSLLAEYPNAAWATDAALHCNDTSAIAAATGLARFSVRTGIGYAGGVAMLTRACQLAHRSNDGVGEAGCLRGLGEIAYMQDRYGDAAGWYQQAQPLFHQAGDRRGEASCLRGLGDIAGMQNRYEDAAGLYQRAQPLFHEAGERRGEAWCLERLGDIGMARGQTVSARSLWAAALDLYVAARDGPFADRVRRKLSR